MRLGVWLSALLVCWASPAFAQQQLMVNGGFETVEDPWAGGGNPAAPQLSTVIGLAHAGTGFLSFGQPSPFPSNGQPYNQYVYQRITFPTNSVDEQFSFYYNFYDEFGLASVAFQAQIADGNGMLLTNLLSTTFIGSSSDEALGSNYYHQVVVHYAKYAGQTNLAPFAGQTVRLYLSAQRVDGTPDNGCSLNIDDVSLLVGTTADVPSNDNFAQRAAIGSVNSFSASGANIYASKEPGEPNHGGNYGGKSVWWSWTPSLLGTVTIDTTGSQFPTLLGVYTGSSVSNLTRVASANGFNNGRGVFGAARVTFNVTPGTEYEIALDGYNAGSTDHSAAQSGYYQMLLKFVPDVTHPVVTIKSPAPGAKLTNGTVVVTGKASDNIAVALVQCRVQNADGTGDYQDAVGTNAWSITFTNLTVGPNTVWARAFDTSGNVSPQVTRPFTYAVVSPLMLTTNGRGSVSVSPKPIGGLCYVNATYILTAKPGSGYLFSGWTGDEDSSNPKLVFMMHTNEVLAANFVPNPFIQIAGNYLGLFSDVNVRVESAGMLTVTLKSSGIFTGKLKLAAGSYALSGQFGLDGYWSNTVTARNLPAQSVQLQLDLAGNTLSGQISNPAWTAGLTANRDVFSKTNHSLQQGSYTLVIPGAAGSGDVPAGDGYGTVKVDALGNVTLAGALADGTKLVQKAFVSQDGAWPLFAVPYSTNGLVWSWLAFSSEPGTDIQGTVSWIKNLTSAKHYPGGFATAVGVVASEYAFTNRVPVLSAGTNELLLTDGDLGEPLTNWVVLATNDKVTSSNRTSVGISAASGLFKGSALPPFGKAIPFTGVILQKQGFASGFFLGTNESGRVYFGPEQSATTTVGVRP